MHSEHTFFDPNGHPVGFNQITYFPENDVRIPFTIYSFAGPPQKDTIVYIDNPYAFHNEEKRDFSRMRKWKVIDVCESIRVQGTLVNSYKYPNIRYFEIIISPLGASS
jgi:hypothetical protein